ncbi:MAG: hypothetical protein MPW14_00310 [Candidatus Manganitrophus sp.]|nr:MAG: hypothetical protein MPW14_00310 [Candidatus Manganitrophus sp.]
MDADLSNIMKRCAVTQMFFSFGRKAQSLGNRQVHSRPSGHNGLGYKDLFASMAWANAFIDSKWDLSKLVEELGVFDRNGGLSGKNRNEFDITLIIGNIIRLF